MKNPKLASRYAGALYSFALETDNVDNVYHDILHIQEIVSAHKELKTIFESPVVHQDKKQNVVREIFQNHLCETTYRFFSLVVKKRREPQLLMICNQFIKLYYKNHNLKEAHITSATPLSDIIIQFIKDYLEKDTPFTFFIYPSVDEKLIGGLVIKIDDFNFDASIQAKINKLRAEFSQNAYTPGF